MTRIFIDTDDAENYEDIESELEAYNIDFDYDNGGRMMVDDSDADIVISLRTLELKPPLSERSRHGKIQMDFCFFTWL